MRIAFARHRRLLVLGMATLLLHFLAIGWMLKRPLPGGASAGPALVITARLSPSASPRAPAAAPATPSASSAQPAAKSGGAPTAQAAPPPRHRAPPAAALPAATVTATAAVPPPPSDVAPGQISAALAPDAAPPMPGRYRVRPPPSAQLAYQVMRSEAGGAAAADGSALLSWQIVNGNYTLRLDSGFDSASGPAHALSLSSEGGIDDAGIAPVTAAEKRGAGEAMITRFERDSERIVFSGSDRSYRINTGSQDRLSLLVQLAGIGVAQADQIKDDIAIYVGAAADAGILTFKVIGQEDLASALGTLATWHLAQMEQPGPARSGPARSGPARPGPARLEVWLAPAHDWLPVQVRTSETDGVVTTLLITRIEMAGATAQGSTPGEETMGDF